MITQQIVSEKLVAYLDNQVSFNQALAWAEQVIASGEYTPDSDIHRLPRILRALEEIDHPQPALTPHPLPHPVGDAA